MESRVRTKKNGHVLEPLDEGALDRATLVLAGIPGVRQKNVPLAVLIQRRGLIGARHKGRSEEQHEHMSGRAATCSPGAGGWRGER